MNEISENETRMTHLPRIGFTQEKVHADVDDVASSSIPCPSPPLGIRLDWALVVIDIITVTRSPLVLGFA